ncbi:MAG: aldose epimerase [Microbacterium sp.]|nr:aldose epimerase [Microbacterium sp.]HAS31066.1 aldose epimerase [Microbacterium sp.]HBS76047.1 aldose epimerase [Microbacterium sp.]
MRSVLAAVVDRGLFGGIHRGFALFRRLRAGAAGALVRTGRGAVVVAVRRFFCRHRDCSPFVLVYSRGCAAERAGGCGCRGDVVGRSAGAGPRLGAVTDILGEQFVLDDGAVRVEVSALAAVLREVRVRGIRITETVDPSGLPPKGCGIVLSPWPNRVADARWQLNGATQQLDVTDVARGGAIHGLLRNTAYTLRERTDRSLTLAAMIHPQHGWPLLLESWVTYALDGDGVAVTHGVRNHADAPAPWAVGAHPYFRVGEVSTDELMLRVDAGVRLELDERLNPVAERDVIAGEFDLRGGRSLHGADLNVAYGRLANRDTRGTIARLEAPDGAATEVWADPEFGWLQVFTPADFPGADGVGRAVALEPMSAPPNALNSGIDLIWLAPGETRELTWGARHLPA